MFKRLTIGVMALGMIGGTALAQEDEPGFEAHEVKVVFDAYTGCWHDRQWDTGFDFIIKRAGFVYYELTDPDNGGSFVRDEFMGGRDPSLLLMDAKGNFTFDVGFKKFGTNSVIAAVGPGIYKAGFGPSNMWGNKVNVTLCFSTVKDNF